MDYNRARAELKPRLREYVESITGKSKGTNMYVCPLCGSGTGSKHTGAFSIDSKDPTRWKCFSCGEGGDIFDLIGKVERIEEPVGQLRRAGELYGIQIDGTAQEDFRSSSDVAQNQPRSEQYTHNSIHTYTYRQDEEDHSAYFAECHNNLQATDYLQKRGISEEVATRFNLGYDSNYTQSTGGRVWQALIIPTGWGSYVARNIDPEADKSNRYRKNGHATPLNYEALDKATQPIFITEGELDALSIIEVGGEAIGLGSTANIDKFIEIYIENGEPAQPLILALDNDEAGRKAEDSLAEKLRDLGIANYRLEMYGGYKDANEALQADREELTQEVAQAVKYVRKQEEEAKEAYRKENNALSHLQEFINGIAESVNTPATPTGFTQLDRVLDGGLYEGLYFIGAVTSLGKTTWALQVADQVADSGRDVLIFSLEMARSELMSKSISRLTVMDILENGGDIRNAKTNRGITAGAKYATYNQTEREVIQTAINSYGLIAKHIYIHEGIGDIGVEDIRHAVKKHIAITGQAPVVIIDYVQILDQPESKHSLTDKQVVDKNVTELKRISREYKIPIIGISSFNRDNYTEPVNLTSFKESGAIEYSSDVLIGLQYEGMDYQEGESQTARNKRIRTLLRDMERAGSTGGDQSIQLKVLKNRNGRKGEVLFSYYPIFNYFKEAE